MATERAPSFPFYVKDWRSSRRVQGMPFAVRGMYLEMLLEQWETGAVPSSPAACAALLGGNSAEWTRAWKKLSMCFTARKRDGLLVNAKLEAVRRARQKYQKAQADSGLRGAEARWKRRGDPIGSPPKPNASPMAKNGSSSSFAIASSSSTEEEEPPPASARRGRPIFTGQRLVVFEFMREKLTRMLGPNTIAFDLPAWFSELDRRAVASACVIPPRDGGAWLQGQTLAEAQRRGLPIAVTPATSGTGKLTARMFTATENIKRTEAPS